MRGICKRFGAVQANDDVSLTVAAGSVHAIVGENGAGKTTLMKILYGLEQPDAGTINLGGAPAVIRNPLDAARLGIGMVHQHFKLIPEFTVAQNVVLGIPVGGGSGTAAGGTYEPTAGGASITI